VTKTSANNKVRIDEVIVERGHAQTIAQAAAMVMSGIVLVDNRRIEKPSELVSADGEIRIKAGPATRRYASRGGLKLEHALKEFGIDVTGLKCVDIGSSTGGFTDCLLQHGAESVSAIDAGTNQLDWRLRTDARVDVRERTNARELKPTDFERRFDLAVVDVSFISVTKILPVVPPLLTGKSRIILLIKPQFEVARHEVGEGGIVLDSALHDRVIQEVDEAARQSALIRKAVIESPILGMEGNKEFLALYERDKEEIDVQAPLVEGLDFYFDGALMVLTARYLLNRGYCCDNNCRHCPYEAIEHS